MIRADHRERELSSVTMINIPIIGNNVNRWEDNRKLNNYKLILLLWEAYTSGKTSFSNNMYKLKFTQQQLF